MAKTRVALHFDKNGNWFIYTDSAVVDIYCIDENALNDRVYHMTNCDVDPAMIDEIIGDSPIGSKHD